MIYIHYLLVLVSLLPGKTIANATKYRLPDNTFPSHYTLRIETNSDLGSADNFTGQVTINISVRYPTDLIVLHADANLKIQQIQLKSFTSGESVGIKSKQREVETQFLKIYTDRMLNQSEQFQLKINFSGHILRGGYVGFSLNKFRNAMGNDEFFAVTVFEPYHARKAFPCYDEPMLKATFDVEVVCGKNYTVHSNAALKEVQMVGEDRKLVRFERTPPMASYLVAFLISRFDVDVRDFDRLKIGMITHPVDERCGDLEFAFRATWFSVDTLQNYTGQKYPFPKLDQVGIESYGGGLENWGLILYQASFLFVHSKADDWEKFDSASIIAHEVAHQFFGNLVGISWWEHLWLKEGFATFMEYKLTMLFLPEAGKVIHQQYLFGTWDALDFDSSPMTFPMSNYVEAPHAIEAQYERSIVYSKAGRVIRMMEVVLGETAFKAGVQDYIANDRFGTADPYKLYLSLHRFTDDKRLPAGVHIADIFQSWATQAGHPIVHVERIGQSNMYRLTQRHYHSCACNGSRWWIPIFYSSFELGERFAGWFPDTTDTITVRMDGKLPLVNSRGYGFYRVSYSHQMWNEILSKWNSIGSIDRAKLIDDAFSMLYDGTDNKIFVFLKSMLNTLKSESSPLPWMAAMAEHNLGEVLRQIKGRSNVELIVQPLARKLTLQMLEKFRNDTRIENKMARETALKWESRLNLTSTSSGRRVRRSKQMYGLCPQMVPQEKIEELRCNARLLDEMLQSVDISMCFSDPDEFLQFVGEVVLNFECPDGLNVVLVLLKRGVPFVDRLLHWLIERGDNLRKSISRDRLEEFLKGATVYIYETDNEQLFQQFIDRLGVPKELRINVRKLLDVHQNRIETVSQMLQGI